MLKQNVAQAVGGAQGGSHLTNLLENQAQENVRLQRLAQEYERREKLCTRKWNALLQENLQLQEKFNAQKQQLQRQREQYQAVVASGERKIIEAN